MSERQRVSAPPGPVLPRRTFLRWSAAAGVATLAGGGLAALLDGCQAAAPTVGTPAFASPSATGAGAATSTPIAVSGALSFVFNGFPEDIPNWQSMFDVFNKQYPDAKLTATPIAPSEGSGGVWANYIDAVQTLIAGGKAPDVLDVATEGLLTFREISHPLDEWIARDQKEIEAIYSDIDPIWAKWFDLFNTKDSTYYLPGPDWNTMGIWYNTEIFRDAGVTEPGPEWTWDDFESICKKVTQPGKIYAFSLPVGAGTFQYLSPWLLTNGAGILNADWTTAVINSPEAIEAVQFERMLVEKGYVPAPGGAYKDADAATNGTQAMWGVGRWGAQPLQKQLSKWKILPWPKNKDHGAPFGWDSYPLLTSSTNPEAAWAFVKVSAGLEAAAARNLSPDTLGIPFHKNLLTQWNALGPEGNHYLYENVEYGTQNPCPLNGNEYERLIADALLQILIGNVPVKDGLDALNPQIQALL